MDRNTEPFPSKEIRQMPDAFQIFTGVSKHYILFRLIWTAKEFTKQNALLFCSIIPENLDNLIPKAIQFCAIKPFRYVIMLLEPSYHF